MSIVWVIVEILSIIFFVAGLVAFFFTLITGEGKLALVFAVCIMISIFAGVYPTGIVSENTYEVSAEVTHMDISSNKYDKTNNLSFTTEDGTIAGVLSVSDYDYAVYQIGDDVIVEVTDYTYRNGKTGQIFKLIRNYN